MDICEVQQCWLHSGPTPMEKSVSTSTSAPIREIALVGLAAAAVYTLLAIVSYSPMDPSFSFSGVQAANQGFGSSHRLVAPAV